MNAQAPDSRPPLVVATWFYDEQPGFLDFRYRIEALSREYRLTLVLRDARFERHFVDLDLRCHVMAMPRTGKGPLLRYCLRLALWLRGLGRRQAPRAVLLLGSQLALVRWLLPARLPCLLYWNEHPTHFLGARRGAKKLLARLLVAASFRAAARCAAVMPIGETLRDDLQAHGVPAANLHLLYMGVDARFEAGPHGAPEPPPLRLVYTGTVARERGRDVMLEGLALARQAGVPAELTLVGASAEQRDHCMRRAAQLGLGAALQVVGRVEGEAIPAYLGRAHFGVCLWEDRSWWRFNPPTKLFEYLVAGLPVLASEISTHTRYVQSGRNGWVFRYSAAGFADALWAVWRHRDNWPAWAEQARVGAAPFRWDGIAPHFLALVRKVAGA